MPYWIETSNLLPAEKDIAIAFYGTELRYMPDIEIQLTQLITLTHQACGQLMNSIDVAATLPELCNDLVKYNGILTIEELQIAFKKGYRGEFGEYYGLNNKTYFAWVSAYRYGKDRANAKLAMKKAGENETKKPEPTEAEKEAIIRESAILKFNEFKTTGSFFGNGNVTYNYLDKKGALTFTKEVKAGFMESARNKLISEEKIKKTDLSNVGKSKAIDDFIKELEETEKHPKVIIEAKRLALTAYFIQLIEMDEELKNLI